MGKTFKDSRDDYMPRDKTRVRDGWNAKRKAARVRKAVAQGGFHNVKIHRAVNSDVK
jgi:hypothetical protein